LQYKYNIAAGENQDRFLPGVQHDYLVYALGKDLFSLRRLWDFAERKNFTYGIHDGINMSARPVYPAAGGTFTEFIPAMVHIIRNRGLYLFLGDFMKRYIASDASGKGFYTGKFRFQI